MARCQDRRRSRSLLACQAAAGRLSPVIIGVAPERCGTLMIHVSTRKAVMKEKLRERRAWAVGWFIFITPIMVFAVVKDAGLSLHTVLVAGFATVLCLIGSGLAALIYSYFASREWFVRVPRTGRQPSPRRFLTSPKQDQTDLPVRALLARGEHEPGCTRAHTPRQRCIVSHDRT